MGGEWKAEEHEDKNQHLTNMGLDRPLARHYICSFAAVSSSAYLY